jgi:hypothetical protein
MKLKTALPVDERRLEPAHPARTEPLARRLVWPDTRVAAALGLLVLLVVCDRLSVRAGGINLRLELIGGGAVAAWALLRSRKESSGLGRPGIVEWCLAAWFVVNLLSSVLFSPQPQESLKYVVILAGLLAIYAACFILLRSQEAVVWTSVAWVVAGTGVALLGVLCALLFDFSGPNFGIFLERFYSGGVFTVTPKVQSTLWEPNIYGSLCMTIPVLAFGLSRAPGFGTAGWQRLFSTAVAAGMAGVMLSMTRTVWLFGPAVIALAAVLALRLKLADIRAVVTVLVLPALLGAVVGLGLGISMPSPRWEMGEPWNLSEEQVNMMVMEARSSSQGAVAIPTREPQAAGQATPAVKGTAVAVGQGSAISDRVNEMMGNDEVASLSNRQRIFKQSIEGWLARPILGWGSGSFPLVYPPPPDGGYWIANFELHVLFDTGIVGLLILAAGLGAAFLRGARVLILPGRKWSTTHFALFGLLLAGLGMLAAFQITDGSWLGFTWVYLALYVAATRVAAAGPEGSRGTA